MSWNSIDKTVSDFETGYAPRGAYELKQCFSQIYNCMGHLHPARGLWVEILEKKADKLHQPYASLEAYELKLSWNASDRPLERRSAVTPRKGNMSWNFPANQFHPERGQLRPSRGAWVETSNLLVERSPSFYAQRGANELKEIRIRKIHVVTPRDGRMSWKKLSWNWPYRMGKKANDGYIPQGAHELKWNMENGRIRP